MQLPTVVLVVPPFAGIDRPAIGVHLLQACAHANKLANVSVVYGNIEFAKSIGIEKYNAICYGPTTGLAGERVFSYLSFGKNGFESINTEDRTYFKRQNAEKQSKITYDELLEVAAHADNWMLNFCENLLENNPDIVGCSTTFEQTCSSLAILKMIKKVSPKTQTILGGANCDGEMAYGLSLVAPYVDHVFSGESEKTFCDYLETRGEVKFSRVIEGVPCDDMDALPTLNYREYYAQLETILPDDVVWLPYESSRGCWWGQKKQCTFCGINGQTIKFRYKAAQTVLDDISILLDDHPSKMICMVDNIMPLEYFHSLLPKFEADFSGLHIFYEQKANLTFNQIHMLKQAGVNIVQPGVESLNTDLLKLMKKGVKASQNVALLRSCRSEGMAINWNLLYGFPGDKLMWYEDTLRIISFISHLMPPSGVYHLSIDRFSPYFNTPEKFNIDKVEPMPAYQDIFPSSSNLSKIAYHFVGEYSSEICDAPDKLGELRYGVHQWQMAWEDGHPPKLEITKLSSEIYFLVDTRNLDGNNTFEFLTLDQAIVAVHGVGNKRVVKWAFRKKIVITIGADTVPLAVCSYKLFDELKRHVSKLC